MANKLELIENYVVFSDTATGDNLGEYAVNHCVYTEEADRFEIKEVIDNGRLTITKTDIAAGKWVDAGAVAYTETTMRDFLRANTGFKAAGGGSPAIPEANLQLQCRLAPLIRQLYYDGIGFVNLTFIRTGIGAYTLQWDNTLAGGFSVMISNPYGTLSTFTGEQMYKTVISTTSIALKVVDNNGTLVDSGDFEVWIKFFAQ